MSSCDGVEDENNGRIIQLKGYDILDTITGRHTTRTREDIRIKKKSKLEDKIYKEYVEFLNKMHKASNENTQGEDYKKPLFKEKYEKPIENQFQPPITQAEHVEPTTEPPEQEPTPPEEVQETIEETQTEQPAPATERKISRKEKNLKSNLGDYWRCTDHDPHYDVTGLKQDEQETEPKMEDYWILEDEEEEYFKAWKTKYQQINQNHKV
jgi:hypothetical protein